ncbi:MAG: hypothetical protein R3190_06550 [Thermoanaerobaculia bacterium]|nr:hypothetical protein [Thermoanaerobaculia bacterium]
MLLPELLPLTRPGAEAVRAYQSRRLRRLVDHAYERVPFYRARLRRAGLHPRDVRSVDDLAALPVTERRDLQLLPPTEVCARGLLRRASRVVTTSGSSGEPLTVRRTPAEERLLLLLRARAIGEWARGLRTRRAVIDHLGPQSREETRTGVHERLGILPRLCLDWRCPKEELVGRIEAFAPDLVAGPPSVLAWVADTLTAEDRSRLVARRVLTGAETLTPGLRRRITDGFGLPIVDLYGAHEVVFIAMESPGEPGYRVCWRSVIVEVLPVDGSAAAGEVVVTALHSMAMPFLRYRLGDLVQAEDDGPVLRLRAIEGRVNDRFRLPDGRWLHGYSLGEVVESSGLPLRRFQITQTRPDAFRVRLVVEEAPATVLDALRRRIVAKVGGGVEVTVEVVAEIPHRGRKTPTFVAWRPSEGRARPNAG